MRTWLAPALAAAVLVGACGSGDDGAGPSEAEATTVAPAASTTMPAPAAETTTVVPPPDSPSAGTPSAGCGTPAMPGTSDETLDVDGTTRSYVLTVPPTYAPDQPAPLVFDFHGLGADGPTQSRYSRLDAVAAPLGYVVVTPTGSGEGRGRYWILPDMPGGKDVAYFDALRERIETTLCIDERRVYAAGISNGAAFASGLACDGTRGFAAIASVSGLSPCESGAPVPLIAFHGTADPVYPYDGGTLGSDNPDRRRLRRGDDPAASLPGVLQGLRLPGADDAVATWAAKNGCDPNPAPQVVGSDVERRTYANCNADAVFYRIVGGGHTWPGASVDVPLGPTTHTIDATELIVEFFERRRAPVPG